MNRIEVKNNERSLNWDNYKGLLIILVVFAHFLWSYAWFFPKSISNQIVSITYLFHMAAFIFCSGYFSISKNAKSKKGILKLAFAYLIFNTLMMLFMYFYNGSKISFLTPYNSYWYLLSLICWRLIIEPLDKIKGIIPISIIVALLTGYCNEFGNILSIRRTLVFFPFFLIGYKIAKNNLLSKPIIQRANNNTLIKILCGLMVILFTGVLVFFVSKYNFSQSRLLMGSYRNNIDLLFRIFIFGVASIMILLLYIVMPNRNIPLLTKSGKNSLGIYLTHRFLTYIFLLFFVVKNYNNNYIIYSIIATIFTIVLFGSNRFNNLLNNCLNKLSTNMIDDKKRNCLITIGLVLTTMFLIFNPVSKVIKNHIHELKKTNGNNGLKVTQSGYLNKDLKEQIDSAIKISYVGDLILLKDQVTKAYNSKTQRYEFDDMFQYVKKYFDDSDLSIGVFEGPTAGNQKPYSTSNFGDGYKLLLNFPDEFAESVKKAGIDLVTTANNHLLDMGMDGAYRTLDILDKYGIKHVGSYRNKEEKSNLTIIEVQGVKIAVLSYLSSINNYNLDNIYKDNPHLTSIIPKTSSKFYNEIYDDIKNDFQKAKDSGADLIMVMAHMGTQFSHTTNKFQQKWNKIFADLGADIILGDHSHAVQPIEYINDTVVVNCPGNFANSYTKKDGDATMIVDLYIDKSTKNVIATDFIPMYTQEMKDGYYRALPIYDILHDDTLKDTISSYEKHRINEVSKVVTNTVIKRQMSLDIAQKQYFFINNKYYIDDNFVETINKYKDKKIYESLTKSKKIVFIGDSITEGTKNNYHPYYEPLIDGLGDKTIINISKGGYTTKNILSKFKNQIISSKGDLYIIALGTNDIRYRNKKTCAMTSEDYIKQMKKIVSLIKESNPNAEIIMIAPWISTNDDSISKLSIKAKRKLFSEYSSQLKKYCDEKNFLFINPNEYIEEKINENKTKYLVDFIHPNNSYGIKLYSEAILYSSK